ncbi:unnamed protein product [Protopolystoma xenopodis]|uniref:Uncharacterized protein n=1 Tax=Protopolystoma xenopodis TaxID=117903 RepID=A0A448XJV1_9PLAT|nr:unnamed protein product [Protopolystoma xenopodis]
MINGKINDDGRESNIKHEHSDEYRDPPPTIQPDSRDILQLRHMRLPGPGALMGLGDQRIHRPGLGQHSPDGSDLDNYAYRPETDPLSNSTVGFRGDPI